MDHINVRHQRLNKQNEATFLFTTAPCEMEKHERIGERISFLFFFFSNPGLYRMR